MQINRFPLLVVVFVILALIFPKNLIAITPKTSVEAVKLSEPETNSQDISSNIKTEIIPVEPYQLYSGVLPEMKEIIDVSKNFFTTIIEKSTDEATIPLFAIFPISDKSKEKLQEDIRDLKNKVGPMHEVEYIGYRTIGKLKRYFTLYFISYHVILPIAWELTFYKPTPKGKWQLNYIRFNSDNIYEFIKYPLLKLNLMQKQLRSK